MKHLLLRALFVLLPCLTLQSCIVTSMLFDPAVRAAFIIPEEITPMVEVKENPKRFAGSHIAVSGTVTEITGETFVLEDFITVKHFQPQKLTTGDEIAVEGKVVYAAFSKGRLEMLYTRPFTPRTERYRPN